MKLMNEQRQKQQIALPLKSEGTGATRYLEQGVEARMTGHGTESPVIPEQLMEEVFYKKGLPKMTVWSLA